MSKFVSKIAQRYGDTIGPESTIAVLRTIPNVLAIVVLLKRAYRHLPPGTQDALNGSNLRYRRQARRARRSPVLVKTPVFSKR